MLAINLGIAHSDNALSSAFCSRAHASNSKRDKTTEVKQHEEIHDNRRRWEGRVCLRPI